MTGHHDQGSVMSAASIAPEQSAAWRVKAAVTLAELAQHVLDSATDCPEYVTRAVVQVCCPHITDDAERLQLWAEYLAAARQEHEICEGLITWQQVDPELLCTDRTQAAIDMAVEMSKQALEALTGRAA